MTAPAAIGADLLEKSRILVVDDQTFNRRMIEMILRRGGFQELLFAENGVQALAIAEQEPVDCFLLDVMMPGMDGWDVCRTLRAGSRHERTPIIIQTALARAEDRHTAFEVGASDIVAKPLDAQELVARVRVHLANQVFASKLLADRERMEGELLDAQVAAEALLPDRSEIAALESLGLTLDYYHRPCQAVGGDYWAVWPVHGGGIGLFVGDVAGHGVSAALRASALNALLMPPLPFADDPLRLMRHLDGRLSRQLGGGRSFVAGAYLMFDQGQRTFTGVGAGLRNALLVRADGTVAPVDLSGLPLGLIADIDRETLLVTCAPGDTLLVYTDALVESEGVWDGEVESSLARWLSDRLASGAVGDGRRLATNVAEAFLDRLQREPDDDLLIVSALVTG